MTPIRWFLVAGLIVLVGLVGWTYLRAPEAGSHSMAPPDTAALGEGAPIVEVRMPAELSTDAQIGQRAFAAKCAACHGEDAGGRNGAAPPLVHQIYEPNHHGDTAFLMAAQNGVASHHWSFGNMPPVDGVTRADVIAIVAYVRELQRANGIE